MRKMSKGLLLVISGPSGVGKGTVLSRVFAKDSNLFYSISATTRAPRKGEKDGVQYYFISKERFESLVHNDGVLEYAEFCDNYYGTPRAIVEEMRQNGKDVVLEIERNGALQVMEKCNDAISIFIMPPSVESLKERLVGRGTEDEAVIEQRMKQASLELAGAQDYKYIVVNDEVERAADEIIEIIKNNRNTEV